MRILVILNDLDIGGAQNYTISLMNEFVRLGHSVELRVLSNNLLLKDRLDCNIRFQIWPRKNTFDLSVLLKIRREIQMGGYHGVISSYPLYIKLATLFLSPCSRFIYPIHTTVYKSKKVSIISCLLLRFKRNNEVFLTSIENQTEYLTKLHKLKENFFSQIYNGVDINRFTLPPPSFNKAVEKRKIGIDENHQVILMVAGYREEKRHIVALRAFKDLKKTNRDVSLLFVGDNRVNDRNKLKMIAIEEGINNVIFFSASEAGDVRLYYWLADIFTLTSNKVETFPISVLEALATGLPCVLTNVGGVTNIINNENGIVVEPESIVSISNGWNYCLNKVHSFSSVKIRSDIINKYSITNSAIEYSKLFNKNLC
jgi:glycosyltransferase involved in cell wall biosynthesis